MPTTLLIHIIGGSLAILAGYTALFATKGAALHRRAGMAFVWAMLVMTVTAAVLAVTHGQPGNLTAAALAFYLTVTGMATVRERSVTMERVGLGMFLVAMTAATGAFTVAFSALGRGRASVDGAPVPMLFLFGTVALLAGVSDIRILRGAELRGVPRLRRHLWRISFACFIATGSFFLGQADEIPKAIRFMPLLFVLALGPLVSIPWWLWRVRLRGRGAATSLRPSPQST